MILFPRPRIHISVEHKRCILVSTKPGPDFSKACARPAMQPPISATYPHSATRKDRSLGNRTPTRRGSLAALAWTTMNSVMSATAQGRCYIARRPKMASSRKPTVSVPRATRHATAWDPAAVNCARALRPCAADQATTARSTSQSSTMVRTLTTLARRSSGLAAQRLRGIAPPKKWPSTWRRAYPRSSPDARPP
jgi:hypothetical protein